MRQQDAARAYILASGVGHVLAELLQTAFACSDLDASHCVRTHPTFIRAPEQVPPIGDPRRARRELG